MLNLADPYLAHILAAYGCTAMILGGIAFFCHRNHQQARQRMKLLQEREKRLP
jgi:hypothetical protein